MSRVARPKCFVAICHANFVCRFSRNYGQILENPIIDLKKTSKIWRKKVHFKKHFRKIGSSWKSEMTSKLPDETPTQILQNCTCLFIATNFVECGELYLRTARCPTCLHTLASIYQVLCLRKKRCSLSCWLGAKFISLYTAHSSVQFGAPLIISRYLVLYLHKERCSDLYAHSSSLYENLYVAHGLVLWPSRWLFTPFYDTYPAHSSLLL